MGCSTIGLSVILALGMLAAPLTADAQPLTKVYRIGWLDTVTSPPGPSSAPKAFLQGLRELGYVEGQNLVMEYRWSRGQAQLSDLAGDLVRLKVDVIVAGSSGAIFAATQATTTIPIVIYAVMNPVDAGLVASQARPGNNITGVSTQILELNGKLLELLKEAVPHVSRVAVLRNPNVPGAADVLQEVQRVAQAFGIELQSLEVRSPDTFESAFDAATREGASALLMLPALLFNANGRQQSWVRNGKYAGHHRGLRAGHVSRGVTRERGRATCLLDAMPGLGDRVTKGPGAVWALRPDSEPCGDTTNARSAQGIGKRATSEATREGHSGSRSVA